MKKKFFSLLLSSAVLVTALAGCNNNAEKNTDGSSDGQPAEESEEPDEDEEASGEKRILKFDAFSGGNNEEVFAALEEKFEAANPDVDLQVRIEKELPDVLNKENATGEYSDLVYFNLGQPSGYTETQLNTGEVLEISDVFDNISDRMQENFKDSPISNYFGDGKQYLLPLKYSPTGFFYNSELVGEGKKYELPETWDDMWALGEQAKADGVYLFTYPVQGYFDTVIQALLDANGGPEFLGKAMKYSENTWESEEGKQTLETIGKLVGPDYLHPDTVANANAKDGFKLNQQAVIDGKALFMPNGDWIAGEMEETTPEEGFHWGLMPLPANKEGDERVATAFTEQIWIPKQANNPDDAKALMEYIYSEEGTELMAEYGFILPVEGVQDLIADDLQKEFFDVFEGENVRASVGAFASYDALAIPDVDFKAVVYDPINEIANGSKTVDEWQSELIDLWTTLRENPVKAEE